MEKAKKPETEVVRCRICKDVMDRIRTIAAQEDRSAAYIIRIFLKKAVKID